MPSLKARCAAPAAQQAQAAAIVHSDVELALSRPEYDAIAVAYCQKFPATMCGSLGAVLAIPLATYAKMWKSTTGPATCNGPLVYSSAAFVLDDGAIDTRAEQKVKGGAVSRRAAGRACRVARNNANVYKRKSTHILLNGESPRFSIDFRTAPGASDCDATIAIAAAPVRGAAAPIDAVAGVSVSYRPVKSVPDGLTAKYGTMCVMQCTQILPRFLRD